MLYTDVFASQLQFRVIDTYVIISFCEKVY